MRISLMTPEEKAAFRLKPGLGGQSSSFYERIIKKIYGRDHGLEAIQALYDSPAIAAPIILNRLKQKDEEWKRALREWNKVWREVDAKNYYRSLDVSRRAQVPSLSLSLGQSRASSSKPLTRASLSTPCAVCDTKNIAPRPYVQNERQEDDNLEKSPR